MSFVHLHVYSAYSLLSSTASIEQLVADAKNKGFKAIALTDVNVMYGTVKFYKECLKQEVKPIIGLTVNVLSEMKEGKSYPIVLLAKNGKGYSNLLKISSVIGTKSPLGIPIKWLRAYADGLIGITSGLGGEIEDSLLNEDQTEARACATLFKSIFSHEDFYLGIQNHGLKEEAALLKNLVQLSREMNINLVATNEVKYLGQDDAFAQKCLLAIKNGEKLQEVTEIENDQYYLKTANEMVELFSDLPEALENSLNIAEKCNVMIELNKKNLPRYPLPKDTRPEDLLEKLCLEGFQDRYPEPTKEHKERLKYEIEVIKKMDFSDYFLIVWDFMKYSRMNGILTGPGRGSAAGSMVAYVLYITDVDPIEHQLLFERFLNPERVSMPDIDIDFPDNRRDEVIEYVSKKYGDGHVAQIITFGTLSAKAVLRDVGRVFGLNTGELDMLSRLIPSRLGITLKGAWDESVGLQNFVSQSPFHAKLFETALKLEGLPRHTSTHAAGVVISEKPLVDSVPIQSGQNNVYLTQYSMEYLEEVGLLKMDFLGLRNLTLIESILDSVHHNLGKKINIKSVPLQDDLTFNLLSKGETTGIFQLESEGMRNVLKNLKPSHFEDIVAVNALYRPGPMENIPLFVSRKHGVENVTYPHPDLEPILKKTYGVIVYQEQIMQIASKMAGFSLGEADILRRAVGKKKKSVLDKERYHFVNGALKKGYNQQVANNIYDLIVKFANYGFNRSHAVAYSFIAYQLAFLKANYPLFFMSALLSSAVGNESKIYQYIRECKEMEMEILPPSINKSGYTFLVENGSIRYSLSAIKGIGVAVQKEIFKARKKRKFEDLFDFCLRVSIKVVNRKTLEALVHSGSFDEFGEDRATLLASLDVAIEHAQLVKPEDDGQVDLFSEDEFMIKPKYVQVEPILPEEKLKGEQEVLGLYLSDHPVSIYETLQTPLRAHELSYWKEDSKYVRTIAYLSEVKKIRTKKGEAMAFLTISDQSGDLEAVAFPKVFKRLMVIFQKGSILFFEGKMETKSARKQLIIQNVVPISEAIKDSRQKEGTLYLKIEEDIETSHQLQKLKEMLSLNRGTTDVVLFYDRNKRTIRLGNNDRVNPTEDFIIELRSLLGEKNVILKY